MTILGCLVTDIANLFLGGSIYLSMLWGKGVNFLQGVVGSKRKHSFKWAACSDNASFIKSIHTIRQTGCSNALFTRNVVHTFSAPMLTCHSDQSLLFAPKRFPISTWLKDEGTQFSQEIACGVMWTLYRGGAVGAPVPVFRGKFYAFPAFRSFFSCFPAFCHFSLSFWCFPVFRSFSKVLSGFRSFKKQFSANIVKFSVTEKCHFPVSGTLLFSGFPQNLSPFSATFLAFSAFQP